MIFAAEAKYRTHSLNLYLAFAAQKNQKIYHLCLKPSSGVALCFAVAQHLYEKRFIRLVYITLSMNAR